MRIDLLLTISIILLFGCNNPKKNKTEKSTELVETKEVLNEVISLSLMPNVFKLSQLPDMVEVKMTNNTNNTITTGLHYKIERNENNEWKEVSPKDMVFHDLGWRLTPGHTENFEKQLYKDQINYKIGKYRIAKYYLKADYQKSKQNYTIYAEFSIAE